jgi:hypothetical protein
VTIGGKVRGHPVKNNRNTSLMAGIDKGFKVIGIAKATGRRIQAYRLIPPAAIKRVFRNWQ